MTPRRGRLIFLGTGATPPPPGRKNAAMLLIYQSVVILFDAPPDLEKKSLIRFPQAIFLTDRDPPFVRSARRLAEELGIRLAPVGRLRRPFEIIPHRVIHTKTHPTYGYRIETDQIVAYAPEFFRFPEPLVRGADLAILDGATWGRTIHFAGRSGGHHDAEASLKLARDLGVSEVYFTHIGKQTEAGAPDKVKMRDGRVLRF